MRYNVEKLTDFCRRVMEAAGLTAEEADVFAQSLVYADLRGVASHGVTRLSVYSKRVSCGAIRPNAQPEILSDSGAVITVDGRDGIGSYVARKSVDWCIERAERLGCCCASVKNGTHFGSAAFFTEYAAKKGMICYVISNSEAAVVPTGGAKPMLGTNPLSLAIPAGRYEPYVLDMATSTVARGKVVLAQKEGHSIPNDWGVDKNGAPTTDPAAILDGGAMLPFGGPKGYAISLMIDLMCSGLSGSLNCRNTPGFWTDFEHHQNLGYFICVIDPRKFMPQEAYDAQIDGILDEFKACPTAPGVKEVMIPGEIEHNKYVAGLELGVELSEAVVNDLVETGKRYGIEADFI
ncbi:MAG: Ldh family oxidoreductase [Oscillospiraceae bacterium]|nr:Ldh family oxidoreductase [Oscillospiraceae bacterium]MBQ3125678.1 Ldh family oxidoreductase [Clostridia bacterium]